MKFIVASAILAISTVVAQSGNPCGLRTATCPVDQTCRPDNPSCLNPDRCIGSCAFKNTYPSCGGFRIQPVNCGYGATCRDDPREVGSCGMACDRPGICIPRNQRTCVPAQSKTAGCPPGLFCYEQPAEYRPRHSARTGICL